VDRALRAEEARPILEGLTEGAGRFEDGDWLVALLANDGVAEKIEIDPIRALTRLPPGARAAVAARAVGSADPKTLARLVAVCPGPWPDELAEAVLAAVGTLGGSEVPDQGYYELVRAAATGIRPGHAGRLADLASHGDRLRPALEGAVETIRFRAELGAAFAALPPLTNKEPR